MTDAVQRVGTLKEYYAATRQSEDKITLEWENLEYSTFVKDPRLKQFVRKDILRNVTGHGSSGELLAIMGPTGCGKTSLMNILAARVPSGGNATQKLTGSITVNGKPRKESQFRRWSAYVLQDDFLYAHLTVHETLLLAANFFLPTHMPQEEKLNLIDLVIAELGLRKARDTIIGDDKNRGVSGGERKRANIAVQLITDPAVLFLDEPTSGLDSFQALSVMECMKDLADNGRLVISVIHQPRSSIYNMFDKLLLLSEGRTMYFGPSADAVGHFARLGHDCPSSFNPADYFLDILSPDNRTDGLEKASSQLISTLGDAWSGQEAKGARLVPGKSAEDSLEAGTIAAASSDINKSNDIVEVGNTFDITKFSRNLMLLCWRSWAEQSRDVVTLGIKCMVVTFFALIIGGIYSNIGLDQQSIQNRNGLLFFVGKFVCVWRRGIVARRSTNQPASQLTSSLPPPHTPSRHQPGVQRSHWGTQHFPQREEYCQPREVRARLRHGLLLLCQTVC